jgi:hypothetical protein
VGESGLLNMSKPTNTPLQLSDYQVVDIAASDPNQLATVKDVKHTI